MDKILCYDYSNETSSAVLLHGTIFFSIPYKMKFGIFLGFSIFDTLNFCEKKELSLFSYVEKISEMFMHHKGRLTHAIFVTSPASVKLAAIYVQFGCDTCCNFSKIDAKSVHQVSVYTSC